MVLDMFSPADQGQAELDAQRGAKPMFVLIAILYINGVPQQISFAEFGSQANCVQAGQLVANEIANRRNGPTTGAEFKCVPK
jgi:hypothetical protein